jgi:hypothetical protein
MKKSRHDRWTREASGYSLGQAAKLAGVSEGLLILWINTKRFTPSIKIDEDGAEALLGWNRFVVTDHDLTRLRKMVEGNAKTAAEHAKGTNWKVLELAEAWGVSSDTIRDLFKNEEGIVPSVPTSLRPF